MRSKRGFSLIEVLIAVAIMALLMGGIFTVMSSTSSTHSTAMTTSNLEKFGGAALDRIVEDIRNSTRNITPYGGFPNGDYWAAPVGGAVELHFTPMISSNPGGPPIKGTAAQAGMYRLRYDEGVVEAFPSGNNVDNDRDGVVDNCRLVRVINGVDETICHNIAEGGLVASIDATTRVLTVTLTMIGVDSRRQIQTRVVTTQVRPNNP